MTMKAPSYNKPAIGGGLGNLSCDIIEYTFDGTETVANPILLRKKLSHRNTYVRATIVGSATFTAGTAANLGVVNREGGADDLDALNSTASVLTVATQNKLVAPYTPGFDHDLALTPTVLATPANEIGETIQVVLEFVATS